MKRRRASSRASRPVLWIALLVAIELACAISVPPSGGPEDKTPPKVVGTNPKPDSSGVAANARISITFSEDMTRARLERLVTFSPDVEIGRVEWKGRTVIIEPARGLHPDTTYQVQIAEGFRDNHNVANKSGYQFAFATSAAIDSGTISGRVFFRREPTKNAVVRCFVLPKDSSFAAESARPDREAKADAEGKYSVGYLPNRENAIVVWAFEDANNNRSFNPDKDVAVEQPDTVVLTARKTTVVENDIYIVDPKEPAVIAGVIANRTGADTVAITVTMDAVNDTTPPTYYTKCDAGGAYEFKALAGAYVVRGFIDFFPDSLCGVYPCADDSAVSCPEPCITYPDTIVVAPGDEVKLSKMILEPAVPRQEERNEN